MLSDVFLLPALLIITTLGGAFWLYAHCRTIFWMLASAAGAINLLIVLFAVAAHQNSRPRDFAP